MKRRVQLPLHTELDMHLRRVVGNTGFSTSGASATLPAASLDARRLQELINVAGQVKHNVTVASGVLTVAPQ